MQIRRVGLGEALCRVRYECRGQTGKRVSHFLHGHFSLTASTFDETFD
jgi:hypothetical protein